MSKSNTPDPLKKFECVDLIMTYLLSMLAKAKAEERTEICDEVTGEIERLPLAKKAG